MKLTTGLATIACMQFLIFSNGFNHVEGRKGFRGSEQEWGFVKVRPYANMFWWLHYTTANVDVYEKPLLIWLQGGPGASSSGYRNFEELGPFDLDLKPRNFTWVNDYNVLFIDNPVGSGYSYSESINYGYALNNTEIALDLLECMKGFYGKDPKWLSVPVYITSQSYGGKMAVEFAVVWDKAKKAGEIKISDLKGVVLISPWISPIDSVLSWAPFLLHMGLVDTKGYKEIQSAARQTELYVLREKWDFAQLEYTITKNYVTENTINIDFYNILSKVGVDDSDLVESQLLNMTAEELMEYIDRREVEDSKSREFRLMLLMTGEVKDALSLNTSSRWGSQKQHVYDNLERDLIKPVTNLVEYLLNETNIEVFVITGQLDLIVTTPGTVAWVEKLTWKNSTEWHSAPRRALVVEGVIEGYLKEYGKLKLYWVNRSGHMVPQDNPAATAAILKHLTHGNS